MTDPRYLLTLECQLWQKIAAANLRIERHHRGSYGRWLEDLLSGIVKGTL